MRLIIGLIPQKPLAIMISLLVQAPSTSILKDIAPIARQTSELIVLRPPVLMIWPLVAQLSTSIQMDTARIVPPTIEVAQTN